MTLTTLLLLVLAQESLVLRTPLLIDGSGSLFENRDVEIRGGSIREVRPSQGTPSYELGGLTLLPGLIDTHVHLSWHFDRSGRLASDASEEGPEEQVLYAAENAYKMLMAGFTTVQSLGAPVDKPLRDAIDRGVLPGPRILTSLRSVTSETGDPDAIRAFVRQQAAEGADVIKIFASASIRDGGEPTLTKEQVHAACSEAARLGLRSVVHAHGPESARRTVEAGCTTIEHGALLDEETMSLMAEKGVYFDPNTHLIFQNYFDNKSRYLGIGNYTEEGFRQMENAVPSVLEAFKIGLGINRLKIVFGTDAVAGAHGRNVEELVYRVETGGQDPHQAILGATSLAAESLGLENEIGQIRAGMAADLIAVEGNPLEDISALRRVRFVMRSGTIYKFER
ncbi:MAG TPA: amidohydrolase family protein [Vicinamibacteria bacterium]|nr:amidohydrolase family protein [Vicinamibacteria bacterium]